MERIDNEGRFFDFLELAPRSKKPRTEGLTCIGDEGDPVPWVRNMLEIWGDYADSVKFVPALLMMPSRIVEERVKLYRDFGMGVALAARHGDMGSAWQPRLVLGNDTSGFEENRSRPGLP